MPYWNRETHNITPLQASALLYLLLPIAVWLVLWVEPWYGIPVAALAALSLAWRLRVTAPTVQWKRIATVAVITFIAVSLSRAGNIYDAAVADWIRHSIMFHHLAAHSWPVEIEGYIIRGHLGYYIVPALIGKLWAPVLAYAIYVWTLLGIGLLLGLFACHTRGWTRVLICCLFLLAFSNGPDLLKVLLFPEEALGQLPIYLHVMMDLPYFGTIWSLFGTVPHHIIGPGIGILLLYRCSATQRLEWFIPITVGTMFWSAYSGVGVGLFSAVLIILDKPWHHLPDWKIATSIYPIWLGAGFLMLGYLTAGAPGVEWMMTPWYRYTLYLIDILPFPVLIWFLSTNVRKSPLFYASAFALLTLPIIHIFPYGESMHIGDVVLVLMAMIGFIALEEWWTKPRNTGWKIQASCLVVFVIVSMAVPVLWQTGVALNNESAVDYNHIVADEILLIDDYYTTHPEPKPSKLYLVDKNLMPGYMR